MRIYDSLKHRLELILRRKRVNLLVWTNASQEPLERHFKLGRINRSRLSRYPASIPRIILMLPVGIDAYMKRLCRSLHSFVAGCQPSFSQSLVRSFHG